MCISIFERQNETRSRGVYTTHCDVNYNKVIPAEFTHNNSPPLFSRR